MHCQVSESGRVSWQCPLLLLGRPALCLTLSWAASVQLKLWSWRCKEEMSVAKEIQQTPANCGSGQMKHDMCHVPLASCLGPRPSSTPGPWWRHLPLQPVPGTRSRSKHGRTNPRGLGGQGPGCWLPPPWADCSVCLLPEWEKWLFCHRDVASYFLFLITRVNSPR